MLDLRCAILAAVLGRSAVAFYLPGVAPREFDDGAPVNLKVNKLTSSKTQLPYSYYRLPYCKPETIIDKVENLGEILTGDMIESSAYEIKALVNESCKVVCKQKLQADDKNKFRSMIEDEYLVNWIIDNLPAATRFLGQDGTDYMYMSGFPVGVFMDGKYYVHNHVKLYIQYHQEPDLFQGSRIVGFEVEPRSFRHGMDDKPCAPSKNMPFDLELFDEVVFTYDVQWESSPVRWASRWDSYLKMTTAPQIHWFSILNSLMIMVFLSGMVAMIVLRTVYRDITKYNEFATAEEAAEETGWKLVHGDVFRKPNFSRLLASSVGCGIQVLGMSIVTMVFACLGFLSPAHRGGLLQSMMILFTFMGIFAGYSSTRLYKVMGGDDWKMATLLTAFLFPGFFFAVFFVLNLLIWGEKSSGAVPFVTMFAILVLWFGISVPLVYLGSFMGFKRETIELPVRVNAIPREIPEQGWSSSTLLTCMCGGILPFGAVFTELFFIMSSIWQHQFYYLFGFLALVLIILMVTCAEISIALTYFQLTGEDYKWWWKSFFSCGSSGVYVFLYSILYFNSRLQISGAIPAMLYFGYMFLASTFFGLLTGAVGTWSSFYFVKAIYGSVKID